MSGYGDLERRFPPRNRHGRDVDVLAVEISSRDDVLKLDPNGVVAAVMRGDLVSRLGRAHPEEFGVSVLSRRPGYRYFDSDVEMVLAPDELVRFLRLDLRPEEYFGLRDTFGIFFMIHDDFYDPGSGMAVQPRPEVSERPARRPRMG
jgi:hypothetical protein